MGNINRKCEELTAKKESCETPKKLERSENYLDNQIKQTLATALDFSSLEKTQKYRNLVKSSAITTKTEGWGCEETTKK